MSTLREEYWIIKSRKTIRQVIRNCLRCKRFSIHPLQSISAPLPEDRIKEAQVFEVIGVDLCGPLFLKDNKKCWIVLFTCAIFRAVHLELKLDKRKVLATPDASFVFKLHNENFCSGIELISFIFLVKLKLFNKFIFFLSKAETVARKMPPKSRKPPAVRSNLKSTMSKKRKAEEMEELPLIYSDSASSISNDPESTFKEASFSSDPLMQLGRPAPELPLCLRSCNFLSSTNKGDHSAKTITYESERDQYCWLCHEKANKTALECTICCRVYHNKCLVKSSHSFSELNVCSECRAGSIDGTELSPYFTLDKLHRMLEVLTIRVFRSKWEKHHVFFSWPLKMPDENIKLARIIDCQILLDLLKNETYYLKTAEFYSDIKFIHHNTAIVYGVKSEQAKAAIQLKKEFKKELKDLEACPECYFQLYCRKNGVQENPFLRLCNPPHDIIWAQLKGYPYWPAKSLKVINGIAHVRFFGKHEYSDIPIKKCYMISRNHPKIRSLDLSIKNSGKKSGYDKAKTELKGYIDQYKTLYGEFLYSQDKTPYQPKEATPIKEKPSNVDEQSIIEESHHSNPDFISKTSFKLENDVVHQELPPNIPTMDNTTTCSIPEIYEDSSQREESLNDSYSNAHADANRKSSVDKPPDDLDFLIQEDLRRMAVDDPFSIVEPVIQEVFQNECSVDMNDVPLVYDAAQNKSKQINTGSLLTNQDEIDVEDSDDDFAVIDVIPVENESDPSEVQIVDQPEGTTTSHCDWIRVSEMVQRLTEINPQLESMLESGTKFVDTECAHLWTHANRCHNSREHMKPILRELRNYRTELRNAQVTRNKLDNLRKINSSLLLEYIIDYRDFENLKKIDSESIKNARFITLSSRRTATARCNAEYNAKLTEYKNGNDALKKQIALMGHEIEELEERKRELVAQMDRECQELEERKSESMTLMDRECQELEERKGESLTLMYHECQELEERRRESMALMDRECQELEETEIESMQHIFKEAEENLCVEKQQESQANIDNDATNMKEKLTASTSLQVQSAPSSDQLAEQHDSVTSHTCPLPKKSRR
ncbi:protein kinase C-binding protein 1 [Caerostris darwini]|uniref:Protein kinase C-binding protein 1 n=1 Tax=Caerostris darwini TaxID=1538125 RepID=A0AAV4WFZ0_9ARAC|nr:protein kinase C-binding protein 1 [Caerostris darwini]